ncbi:MAG: type IX secretion system protein PorQ [Cytophagaceae bacterium]|jgi:hypothetical protein|nr:type IX secretion system protein PorQ [Cytophagaceae bacterium]
MQKGLSQQGGKSTFQFLNVPMDAHTASVGGATVSNPQASLALSLQNPALLRDTLMQQCYSSYIPYFADIKSTSIGYSRTIRNQPYALHLSYLSYGEMNATDETGTVTGVFRPADLALTVSTSRSIAPFTIGTNVKFIYSELYSFYKAYGLYADIGGVFKHPNRDFNVGICVRNLGMPIRNFNRGVKETMPLDVRIGTTYKLEHVPLRLSLTGQHLYKFDVVYLDTALAKTKDLEGNYVIPEKTFGDKILRHFIVGAEFLLSKHLQFRAGYNFMRRKEFRLDSKAGTTGLSWGISLKLRKLDLDFSRSNYHLSGGRNWITLTCRLSEFTKVRKKQEPTSIPQ